MPVLSLNPRNFAGVKEMRIIQSANDAWAKCPRGREGWKKSLFKLKFILDVLSACFYKQVYLKHA